MKLMLGWLFIFIFPLFSGAYKYPTTPLSGVSAPVDLNLLLEFEKEKNQKTDFKPHNDLILKTLEETKPQLGLNQEQVQKLKAFLIDHPIAGDKGIEKYSGKNRTLGFCYGRATLTHVELLRRNLPPTSIRKVFVLGEMKYQSFIWELHIATLAAKKGGGWWVLDGLFDQVYEVQEWYPKIIGLALNQKKPVIRLYLADPVKFLPVTGAYSEKDMNQKYYNGFFKDLSEWLEKNPAKKEDLFF